MKTTATASESCLPQDAAHDASAGFYRKMTQALSDLKVRLRQRYHGILPGNGELVDEVIAESEMLAEKTAFPLLLLPDFVQARIEALLADGRDSLPALPA